MKQNVFFTLIIGLILLFSIKSNDEPILQGTGGKYTLDDILDAATRVKQYVLNNKKLPKIVRVSSDEISIAQCTYSMGIDILNIHNNRKEDKIPTIKLESPTTPHRCNIKVLKANYIDATKRVVAYCEKNGAAPAYVVSSSVEIGYAEYSFGFSKILAFYKTEKALPLYNQFDSSVFDDTSGEIIGVRIKKGINEKNTESNLNKYLDNYNDACRATDSIRAKAKQLTSGCTTTLQKARAIFNFVKNQISYKYYENSVYGASRTLANGRGNCCDKANLIVSLCRYSGIPARYSHGQHCHFYRSGHYYGHVWAQILVGKTWYAADATGSGNSLGFINNWNIDTFHTLRQYALIPF